MFLRIVRLAFDPLHEAPGRAADALPQFADVIMTPHTLNDVADMVDALARRLSPAA
jgi:hypothetical protein